MNVPVLSLSLFLNALILFLLFLYFRRKRNEQLAEILQWLMFAAAWWSFFYGMEFIVNNERLIHPLLALEFSAVMSLPVFWLIVAARLSGSRFLSPRNIGWLFVVPALNWLLLLTNPLHSLFYTDAVVTSTDGISQNFISYKPGPMFLFSHFLYSSLALAAGVVMLVRMIVFSKGISRTKALLILVATTLPYGLTLAWILDYRPFGFLDLTSYGFTILGLTFAAVYNHVSAYELRPMVLESLFEHLNPGVIVIDRKNQTIVYTNPQGLHVFDALSERVGPKQVRGYLSSLTDFTTLRLGNEYYQVRVRELAEEDVGKALKLVSFNDVSEIKQHQFNLAALTKITTTFGNDGSANIQKMLALLGEVFGAHTCLYIKKIESFFITAASWCEQPVDQDDQQVKIADGTIYNELLMLNKAEPFVVNSLQQTKYSETDPKVRLHGLNTLLGSVVEIDSKPEAAICVYFVQDRSFSDTDFQFLKLVSFVLSNEEARLKQLQKLNQAEVNLRAILENSLDSIWAVDENFCITYVNDTFKTAFRNTFNVELKVGTKIIETLPKPLQSVWLSRYEKALQGEHFVFFDSVPMNENVTLYIEVSIMPIQLDGKIRGISFFGRDVTQKYLAEQQLIQKEKYLAEQNAAKDRLFSIISHDLRSPFNNIIGLSEVIEGLAEEQGNQTIREYASSILRVSKNTFVALENLLHWSRVQSGKLKLHADVVRLYEVVENELEFQQYRIEQKLIKITNQVDTSHAVVADAQSVAVIVRNLISNAIKFSYSEGEIVLKSEPQNDNVYFAVQDFGCGISIEDQKALFQLDKHPTRRGTQNETGTGLGLILCKELAEKNDGHLLVHSRTGQGSTITLVLKADSKSL